MTETWGSLRPDPVFRDSSVADGPGPETPAAGRWQEELEHGSVAETSLTLPGQGSSGPNCGIWKPAEFCDSCANVAYAPVRCERRACPDCYAEWTRQRAEAVCKRVQAGRWSEPDGIDRRLIHAVVSPPEGSLSTLVEVYDGFRDAYQLAREKGVRGGVAVFHGFRVTEETKEAFRDADYDGGIWRYVRSERPESWRDLVYWSPHFHIIGLSRDFEADDPDAQDGWVARRIRSLEPMMSLSNPESYDDVVGLTRYLMSHATFEADSSRDCVRWFGDLSTNSFSPEEELSEGAYETIQRVTEEVVGYGDDRGDGPADDEAECEDCGSSSWSSIFDAGGALCDPAWCDSVGRDAERELTTAFQWAIGEIHPPPGLRNPTSEEQVKDAMDAMRR